jgi:hypothetical protein
MSDGTEITDTERFMKTEFGKLCEFCRDEVDRLVGDVKTEMAGLETLLGKYRKLHRRMAEEEGRRGRRPMEREIPDSAIRDSRKWPTPNGRRGYRENNPGWYRNTAKQTLSAEQQNQEASTYRGQAGPQNSVGVPGTQP